MKTKIDFIIILAILGFVLISGCVEEKTETPEEFCIKTGTGGKLDFFEAGPCDTTIGPYNQSELGIKETNWLDDKTLHIKAYVSINCAEEITGVDFEINDDKIILVYDSPRCGENFTCARCMCAHELTYHFSELEKKEYSFELKRAEHVSQETEKLEGAMSVFELTENPVYDTEVTIYGEVSLLGESHGEISLLSESCFDLISYISSSLTVGVTVWYDLMVEDDGTERPSVSVEGIENGDWVIVTGELRSSTGEAPSTTFWANNIEKTDSVDINFNFSSVEDCKSACVEVGYNEGDCKWPMEVEPSYIIFGSCLIQNSRHCGNEGQCNCYCWYGYDSSHAPEPQVLKNEK